MTPEDIKSLAEALVEAIKPSLTELREALVPAPAPNDKEDDKTDRAEIVEAAVEAGIGKAGRARVLSAVDAGASLDEAIKAEKDLVAEILKEHVTDGSDGASGVVTTSGSYSDKSSTAVKGW